MLSPQAEALPAVEETAFNILRTFLDSDEQDARDIQIPWMQPVPWDAQLTHLDKFMLSLQSYLPSSDVPDGPGSLLSRIRLAIQSSCPQRIAASLPSVSGDNNNNNKYDAKL